VFAPTHADRAGAPNYNWRQRFGALLSIPTTPRLNIQAEYIDKTVEILTRAFEGDPVFTWLLQDFPQSQHQSILPRYLRAFFTAASLNRGMFINADGFGCCAVLLPPGARIDNPWTMLPAGLIPAIFATGLRGFKVHAALFTVSRS
jgi:hypothetical protein